MRPQILVVGLVVVACLGAGWRPQLSAPITQHVQALPPVPQIRMASFAPAQALPQLLTKTDCAAVACVALTFDDGPDPTYTPQVLDILQQKQVNATFFMIGYRVAAYPDIAKHAFDIGQEVENHSWNHADFTKLPADQIDEQIKQTTEALMAAGLPAPTMLRPPYGAINDTVRATSQLPLILWNVDPLDWKEGKTAKVVTNVVDAAGPGSIVLMHSVHPQDPKALPDIIDGLRAKGLTIVPVSDLLDLVPGENGTHSHR